MEKAGYDIIMLALPRWDGQYSSTAYSLAQALSANRRVFFIDNPFTVKDLITRSGSTQVSRRRNALLRGKDIFTNPVEANKNLIAVTPKVTLPINWLPAGKIYNLLSELNDRTVFRAIRTTLSHFGIERYVFINSFNPLFGKYFPETFRPLLNIYHCVDDISKSEYISKHGTRLESEAVRRADFTLVTSMELKRLKENDSPNVYYHPNAANTALFQRAYYETLPVPDEFRQLDGTRKVILYMGNICHRLDYALLEKIAAFHHDKTLVMVGPRTNEGSAVLDRFPNVVFTGPKSLEALPEYVRLSDCCIIPFLCNTLTRSIYPLKINEYLSAGKPVVTTNFSEDIRNFGDVSHVSGSHDDFIRNIDLALSGDSPEKAKARVEFAASNNWNARAEELFEIIDNNLKG